MRPLSPLFAGPLGANKNYQGVQSDSEFLYNLGKSVSSCIWNIHNLHNQDIELWIVISAANCWLIATGIIMDNNVQNWIIIRSWGANICHDCHTSITLTQHIPVERWTCAKICRLIETLYLFMQFSRCLNIHWCITFLRD